MREHNPRWGRIQARWAPGGDAWAAPTRQKPCKSSIGPEDDVYMLGTLGAEDTVCGKILFSASFT